MAGIQLPQRSRKYRFALTPLADAMFQLLIFFMLSSGLTPYSMLTLQSAAGEVTDDVPGGADDQSTQTPPPPEALEQALWTIDAETVIVGGQKFGFDALDDLAGSLGVAGAPAEVLLIIRPTAQVQDITTVLARLTAANVTAVKVSTGAK